MGIRERRIEGKSPFIACFRRNKIALIRVGQPKVIVGVYKTRPEPERLAKQSDRFLTAALLSQSRSPGNVSFSLVGILHGPRPCCWPGFFFFFMEPVIAARKRGDIRVAIGNSTGNALAKLLQEMLVGRS